MYGLILDVEACGSTIIGIGWAVGALSEVLELHPHKAHDNRPTGIRRLVIENASHLQSPTSVGEGTGCRRRRPLTTDTPDYGHVLEFIADAHSHPQHPYPNRVSPLCHEDIASANDRPTHIPVCQGVQPM